MNSDPEWTEVPGSSGPLVSPGASKGVSASSTGPMMLRSGATWHPVTFRSRPVGTPHVHLGRNGPSRGGPVHPRERSTRVGTQGRRGRPGLRPPLPREGPVTLVNLSPKTGTPHVIRSKPLLGKDFDVNESAFPPGPGGDGSVSPDLSPSDPTSVGQGPPGTRF